MSHTQEICNLFVPRGAPGFDRMLELARNGLLGGYARPMYARYGRPLNPKDFYRWDDERDGVHVNLKDYLAYV